MQAMALHSQGMSVTKGSDLPYPYMKNTFSREPLDKGRVFSWLEHRLWCEKVWQEGPRKASLWAVFDKVVAVHKQWLQEGQSHKVPNLVEGRQKGIISEVYCMHHLPSGKNYVGMAYHGAHERMRTHWGGRHKEKDPCSTLLKASASPYEWICWPIERFEGPRKGHVLFHKRAANREGWWANHLKSWWAQGLNVAGTGGEHKGGAREDWQWHRETYSKEWRQSTEERLAAAKQKVQELIKEIAEDPARGWQAVKATTTDEKKEILQALNTDGALGSSTVASWSAL